MCHVKQFYSSVIYIGLYSSVSTEYACSAGDQGSITGLERSPGEGNGNLLQYSGLENPMERGLQSMGLQRIGHD